MKKMKNNYNLINFKVRDREYIEKELKAFCGNFDKGITIYKRVGYYKSDVSYLIYVGNITEEEIRFDDYVYRVYSVDELQGWLYGMVQANNGYIKLFKGDDK